MTSARHIPMAAIIIITEKGKALTTDAACKALKPPANNSTAAITPSKVTQKVRCQTGVCAAPPEARESITNEPESDEVTKKVIIKHTVKNDTTELNGSRSKSLNSAMALSF